MVAAPEGLTETGGSTSIVTYSRGWQVGAGYRLGVSVPLPMRLS